MFNIVKSITVIYLFIFIFFIFVLSSFSHLFWKVAPGRGECKKLELY